MQFFFNPNSLPISIQVRDGLNIFRNRLRNDWSGNDEALGFLDEMDYADLNWLFHVASFNATVHAVEETGRDIGAVLRDECTRDIGGEVVEKMEMATIDAVEVIGSIYSFSGGAVTLDILPTALAMDIIESGRDDLLNIRVDKSRGRYARNA